MTAQFELLVAVAGVLVAAVSVVRCVRRRRARKAQLASTVAAAEQVFAEVSSALEAFGQVAAAMDPSHRADLTRRSVPLGRASGGDLR